MESGRPGYVENWVLALRSVDCYAADKGVAGRPYRMESCLRL